MGGLGFLLLYEFGWRSMSKLTKNQKVLMWTILIVALVQMPNLALSPAIDTIKTKAFPGRELAEIQTVMALQSLASLLMSVVAAFLINKGVISKKFAVAFGLFALFLTGVFAAVFNAAYWCFVLMNILLGVATGFYMTNNFGLLFDNFEEEPRQVITGYQTSFINGGGILFGIAGGLAAARLWYGGYLLFLVGLRLWRSCSSPFGKDAGAQGAPNARARPPARVLLRGRRVRVHGRLQRLRHEYLHAHLNLPAKQGRIGRFGRGRRTADGRRSLRRHLLRKTLGEAEG